MSSTASTTPPPAPTPVVQAEMLPKLGKMVLDAFIELGRHRSKGMGRATPYWWRTKSMQKLAEHGLVRRDPRSESKGRAAYMPTVVGEAKLKELMR